MNKSIQDCDSFFKSGFINLGDVEPRGQSGILSGKQFAERIDLGNRDNVIVNPVDCLMMVEVKSTLTGTYLNELNIEVRRIKEANPNIVCGMFACKSELEKKTIIKRCGYDFDPDTKTFLDSISEPSPAFYPYIDFIMLLHIVEGDESEVDLDIQERNQLFMRKGLEPDARYFKGTYDPVIRNLAGPAGSLLIR